MNRNIRRLKNIFSPMLGIAFILAIPAYGQAQEEGVFLDPQTGDYLIRFKSYTGLIEEGIFYPHTKIEPTVKSKSKLTDDGSIMYRYKVRSGNASKQNLVTVIIYASNAHAAGQISPSGWGGSVAPNLDGNGYIVSWSSLLSKRTKEGDKTALQGLSPNSGMAEFGFYSADLPGVGIMRLRGKASITMLPDEGPDPSSPVGITYHELRQKDFVPRPAAVPLIPVPNPFDAAAVLTSMQKHVNQDMVSMKLIDPAFASQLDQLFQAAIDAAKGGNTVALKSDIKDLRQMLKREHADVGKDDEDWDKDNNDGKNKEKDKSRLIDKLAARVLDFDLRYVAKQITDKKGKDKED